MEKRADLQLLRGIAVLAVIFAHFGGLLPAGFLGVDLFFAISGFVITQSFLRLLEKHNSIKGVLREFWLRRFWRLVPSLSVVVTITLLATFILLPPSQFWDQVEMSIWSTFFAGNIGVEIISRPDYFDPAAKQNWLLHLWSLGVEEQFYLLFPLLMLALIGLGSSQKITRRAKTWILALGLVSLLAASLNDFENWIFGTDFLESTTGVSALLGYYSPITRAWQFLIGVAAALLLKERRTGSNSSLGGLGIVIVIASFFFIPESPLLPGPLTILPMAGAFFLLVWRVPKVLTESTVGKGLIFVGDRSYSAYLWHWPIWAVVSSFELPIVLAIAIALATTTAFTLWTYSFLETRAIEFGRHLLAKETQIRAIARVPIAFGLCFPLIFSGLVWAGEEVLTEAGLVQQRQKTLRIDSGLDCAVIDCANRDIQVLLVGDSHAGALANTLAVELEDYGLSMAGMIHVGCLHVPSRSIGYREGSCSFSYEQFRTQINQNPPDVAVLFGYTAGRFTSINSGGEQAIEIWNLATNSPVTDQSGPEDYAIALKETIDVFREVNVPVLIVSGVPDFSFRPEEVNLRGGEASMAERLLLWDSASTGQSVTRAEYLLRHQPFVAVDIEASRQDLVSLVDGWKILCFPDHCAQKTAGGDFIFSDQDHLGPLGAERLADAIATKIVLGN